MPKTLGKSFFDRPTLKVSKELLGKFLVRRYRGKNIALMIIEVEAYDGFEDRASHASRGKTERNKIMFGPAGYWYIYFVYGLHWMLNIVTGPESYPAAILIRSGVLDKGRVVNGPAKLTKFLKIGKSAVRIINGKPADRKTGLWLEDRGIRVSKKKIQRSVRIGVDYAGPIWSKKLWRFYIENGICNS